MSKQAIILTGGKGTRLRPYTVVLPKPLMPIGDYPILEVILRQLKRCKFQDIRMAVNHQAELISAFFGRGEKWGLDVKYSLEDKPLGTMGPLRLIKDLEENFLVMNGDILCDLDFAELFEEHCQSKEMFTIAAYTRMHRSSYGVLETDKKGRLKSFREKPEMSYLVSMGIYVLNRKVLEYIPDGKAFGFDQLMHRLLEAGQPVQIHEHKGEWLDIGIPADHLQASELFDSDPSRFLGGVERP